jgi:hypothetical protein
MRKNALKLGYWDIGITVHSFNKRFLGLGDEHLKLLRKL